METPLSNPGGTTGNFWLWDGNRPYWGTRTDLTGWSGLLLLLLVFSPILPAQERTPWAFGFGVGVVFPPSEEWFAHETPNGLNLNASLVRFYRKWLTVQGRAHLDYFSDERRRDFQPYIGLLSLTLEPRLHLLSFRGVFSPYLFGGAALTLYRVAEPGQQTSTPGGVLREERVTRWNAGYALEAGAGVGIKLSGNTQLSLEWRRNRFRKFGSRPAISYNTVLLSFLFDVDWKL
ncbi:MAG: hypothetical protein D6681_09995 [Calditrichaeota bacterium]|nr:MAG: hypothetical protein D6681_09995 [Calditrichota bacterium]